MESGRTAFAHLGCTKSSGLEKTNHAADVSVGDYGTVSGVSSRSWTTENGSNVSSRSQTEIGAIELGQGDASLAINGVRLSTKAWHDDDGFHKSGDAEIATISAEVGGVSVPIPADPAPGQTIDVPGLAQITILDNTGSRSAHQAKIAVRGLRIELSDGSTLVVGAARSGISDQAPTGLMNGWGRAGSADALDSGITSGNVAVQPLKCMGTDGEWTNNHTAGLDIPGVLEIGAASGAARGNQRDADNGYAQTRGRIAHVMLSDQLEIGGIQAQVRVTERDGELTKSVKGTTVAYIKAGGESFEVPDPGETLEIPGLAKITIAEEFPGTYGMRVVAAEVKLLDGTPGESTVNLGEAFARVKPA